MAEINPEVKLAVMDALRAALTEERTDAIIKKGVSKLPLWLRWLPIGAALDRLLPELLLSFVDENI